MRFRLLCLSILCVSVATALPVSPAAAKIRTETVPATWVFAHANRPGDAGNCSAVVFAQWSRREGATSAKVNYTYSGKPTTKVVAAPFNSTYTLVATYTAPAGTDWAQIGKGWRDGGTPDDCSATSAKQRTIFGPTVTVDLTFEIDEAACRAARTTLTARSRTVSRLQTKLKKATTTKAKRSVRASLTTAKRAKASWTKKVASLC